MNHDQIQKQPFGGILKKRCSENMQQIYRRRPMQKCKFNNVFSQEHLWTAASEVSSSNTAIDFVTEISWAFCQAILTSPCWNTEFKKSLLNLQRTKKLCRSICYYLEAALQRCSYKRLLWKIYSKFTGKNPCRSVISITLQSDFI